MLHLMRGEIGRELYVLEGAKGMAGGLWWQQGMYLVLERHRVRGVS